MTLLNLYFLLDTAFMDSEAFGEGFFGMISAMAATAASLTFFKGRHLTAHGIITEATVYDNRKRSGKRTAYNPLIHFLEIKGNRWISGEVDRQSNGPLQKGTRIEIIYDPENPHDFLENTNAALIYNPLIFMTTGTVGFIFCVLELLGVINYLK